MKISNWKNKIFLIAILLLAAFFRFNNLNWDSNFHLHPDERFLTMVGGSMKIPETFSDYLNPSVSTLNPYNIQFPFYVYGTFPVTLNKLIAVNQGNDTYNEFALQGRALSAFFDLLIVLLIYKTSLLLAKKMNLRGSWVALWSAFLYATAVLPIQLSHFFATDTFLNFFMFASFYLALRFTTNIKGRSFNLAFSALCLGLALATKISAAFILPLNLFFILFFSNTAKKEALIGTLYYLVISYFTLRLADPHYFASANVFDPTLSSQFIDNIKQLKGFENPDSWFPPGVQWLSKTPVIFSLQNVFFFGMGVVHSIFILMGIGFIIFNQIPNSKVKNVTRYMLHVILVWVAAVFLYQSSRFAQTMRYFVILYPFLAIFGGIGISRIMNNELRIMGRNVTRYTLHVTLIIILLFWPVAFSSIYLAKHSRVQASEWIYANLPTGSILLGEHWDDGLPLPVPQNTGKEFQIKEFPVFDQDTPEKWQKLEILLNEADYYVLSSNRGWGSMMAVPERYPRMSKFYEDLFAGRTKYQLIKEFNSYPQIQISNFKFQIPDNWADESFTVYDHPQVHIFKKTN